MKKIAILGFGVVGHGVAELLTCNKAEVARLGGEEIEIAYILDLRDFPDSPYASLVVHDYEQIVADPEVHTVIEVMGGSHPAREYTVAALKAGKHVITSNKEVVANFGTEFTALAKQMGVVYRFEAAVGGGIPIISPLISLLGHNKLCEVRGILNGTTNYILTQMFSFGQSFEGALADAQAKGYAERNPAADIEGTDACRKIAILSALVTGKSIPTDQIHTEGITEIRAADVKAAGENGYGVKLLGRALFDGERAGVMVAPFFVPQDAALCGVYGVYNAVEVLGEPLGNVMMYGPGAGAGATASAVVGDLMQILREGTCYAAPVFTAANREDLLPFGSMKTKNYIALSGIKKKDIERLFGKVRYLAVEEECAFLTEQLTEEQVAAALGAVTIAGGGVHARIRVL